MEIVPLYELDHTDNTGEQPVIHIRRTESGYSEADALAKIIGRLQADLNRMLIKEEIDMALHPEKYMCEAAADNET